MPTSGGSCSGASFAPADMAVPPPFRGLVRATDDMPVVSESVAMISAGASPRREEDMWEEDRGRAAAHRRGKMTSSGVRSLGKSGSKDLLLA